MFDKKYTLLTRYYINKVIESYLLVISENGNQNPQLHTEVSRKKLFQDTTMIFTTTTITISKNNERHNKKVLIDFRVCRRHKVFIFLNWLV